jgi:phosphatidylinositol glycan class N
MRLVVILAVVIVFHAVFLFAVLDLYFRSTVIKNLPPHAPPGPALADRLVLIVADGLRADTFYHRASRDHARFLAATLRERGSFGVSHTRVPTESRPGHVALIAGFFEDVSAIATGWKRNPVPFDSLFNR